MSEGLNVTTGVAMRDPRMGPDTSPIKRKPLPEFEKEIKAAVAQSGKDKVHQILVESVIVNIRDEVTVDGKSGKVVSAIHPNDPDKKVIGVDHGDETKNYTVKDHKVVVTRAASRHSSVADMHLKDAEIGRKQFQMGRFHSSMALYHDNMAKHHYFDGDKPKAEEHRSKAEASRAEAKKAHDKAASQPAIIERPSLYPKKTAGAKIGQVKKFYAVPFAKKDEAKKSGFKWDQAAKSWYHTNEDAVAGMYPEQTPEWNATLRKNHGHGIYQA